jgi:hypothetical protein
MAMERLLSGWRGRRDRREGRRQRIIRRLFIGADGRPVSTREDGGNLSQVSKRISMPSWFHSRDALGEWRAQMRRS